MNDNSIVDDDFQIPFEEFGSFKFIGSGAQGCVFKSLLRGEEVAVKKVKTKEETNVKHLRRLNHQNLVKFKGHSLDNEKVYCIVMEYCSQGNLYSFIEESRNNPDNFIKPDKMINWAKQIASGMSYLHLHKIVHRDLKSPNILIGDSDILKITDFGASKSFNDKSEVMSFTGTIMWMAPEIIKHLTCSEKVDVWSYGVVLWELLLFEAPYMNSFEKSKLIFGVGSGTLSLHVPQSIPNGLKLLLQQCLNYKPRNRPSFSQIMKHLDVSYENDASILKNDALYLKLQSDDWKSTVQAHYDSLTKKIDQDQHKHQQKEYDLIQRRDEELQHAANIREYYEDRLRKANNLYFELNTVLLQLEQREEAIAKKEEEFNIKNGKQRVVKNLIKREFQQKSKKVVLNAINMNFNQKSTPTVENIPSPTIVVENQIGNNKNDNQIVCNIEPLGNANSMNSSSHDKNVNNTSYEIPMSYDQAMQVEADKRSQQRKHNRQKSTVSRRFKQQQQQQDHSQLMRRRATTSRLYSNNIDDYGFQADTEDNDETHAPNFIKRNNIEKIFIDEQCRRKYSNNHRLPYSKRVITDHDDDIDNDNIEDYVSKKTERPNSTDYLDDDATKEVAVETVGENKTVEIIDSENDDNNLTDDTRYAFEYDQKIENLESQQESEEHQDFDEQRMFDYLECSEGLKKIEI